MANATLNLWPDTRTQDDYMRDRQGILAQTFPRIVAAGTGVLTGGTVTYTAMVVEAGTVCTNISISVGTAGASVTLSKVGLAALSGDRLAISADQGTAWQSTGVYTIALLVPYIVPARAVIYGAIVAAAGTLPAVARGFLGTTVSTAFGTPLAGGIQPFAVLTAQTDIPATAALPANTSDRGVWMAIT